MSWSFSAAKQAVDLLAPDGANGEVANYWLSLWQGECAPNRVNFRLKDLGSNSPAAAVFAINEDKSIICEEAGALFWIGLGADLTGQNLLDLTPPEQRRTRLERAKEIVHGSILSGERIFRTEEGTATGAEINLPFADRGPSGEHYYLMHSNWRPSGRLWLLPGPATQPSVLEQPRILSIRNGALSAAKSIVKFGNAQKPSFFFEDPDSLADPLLAELLRYWRRQRQNGVLPRTSDFSPKDVRAYLPWLVIIDALPNYTDFRYRVVGTKVCEYFLADGTGKTVREAFAGFDELAEGIIGAYRRTCMLECPTRSTGPATKVNGVYFPAYDSLYLPYSTDGVIAARIVNAFSFKYDEVRAREAFGALLDVRRSL